MRLPQSPYPAWLGVSRETFDALQSFGAMVEKWNPAINLVSRTTIPDLWDRHILDSAQLFLLSDTKAQKWLDIGSGGGFPGLVVGIIAKEQRPDLHVSMVESDRRKAVFLSEAVRLFGLNASVRSERVESMGAHDADVVSARALASLDKLCGLAQRHIGEKGTALFLKGSNAEAEIEEARRSWQFELSRVPSRTDSSSVVLKLWDIKRA